MRAVQIVGYERAIYTEAPVPELKPDELLVQVKRVGICRSDTEVWRQELGVYRSGRASLPIIPGHEWSGEVVELGSEAKGFAVGDRVTGECGIGCGQCNLCQEGLHNICPNRVETGVFNRQGGYAEFISVPYEYAHRLFDLSFQEGALIEPLTVGLWIARRAAIQPGDRVLIIGTGTIGLLAVQAARLAGADVVVAVGRSPFKLQVARTLGATATINLTEQAIEEVKDSLTQGQGFNVVVESAGNPDAVTTALRAAAPRARVIITGVFEGTTQPIDLNTIMPKELTVIGSLGGPGLFDQAVDLVRRGQINVRALNTHTFPLSAAPEALNMVAQGRQDLIKVQLDLSMS